MPYDSRPCNDVRRIAYYHEARAPLSLDRNSPYPRSAQPPDKGKVVAKAYLGWLHHRYTRVA